MLRQMHAMRRQTVWILLTFIHEFGTTRVATAKIAYRCTHVRSNNPPPGTSHAVHHPRVVHLAQITYVIRIATVHNASDRFCRLVISDTLHPNARGCPMCAPAPLCIYTPFGHAGSPAAKKKGNVRDDLGIQLARNITICLHTR